MHSEGYSTQFVCVCVCVCVCVPVTLLAAMAVRTGDYWYRLAAVSNAVMYSDSKRLHWLASSVGCQYASHA